jgi:serine/threonine protein kinase
MAEIYLGTQQAIGGFRKLVVMKRLLGWQRDDGEAAESLLDEARVAATINHPNIVTTLDIGLDRGSPYIVLEYLQGEDLRYLLQQLHERDASIPLDVACRIGASIAAALAQAHELTLPNGARRCIVHRDVTPSNIIVCYSGVTKLVDFGVARVSDADPKTKSGVVKGKFSYLAPEQLSGAPLDGRTDVFQLGIVLWEMVAMRRLFEGKTDPERLNAVLSRVIPRPSEFNAAVPPCLDRTIMRALERDPARRHQRAQELEEELLEAIGAVGGSGGDHSVAKWMHHALAERHAWRLDLERKTVAEAEAAANAGEDELEVQIDEVSESPWSRRRVQTAPSINRVSSHSSLRGVAVAAPPARPQRSAARLVLPALVVIGAAVAWMRFYGPVTEEPDTHVVAQPEPVTAKPAEYDVDIRVLPATASIAIDGAVIANGRYRASFAGDGAVHTVTLTAPDHTTVQRRFQGATNLEVSLERLTPAPEPVASDDRDRERERVRVTTKPKTPHREPAPATKSTTETVVNGSGGSGSAAQPASPPKIPEESFAPASDNIDPFKTGN